MAESYEREQSSTHLTSGTQIGSAPTPTPSSIDLEAPTGTESTREGQQREGQQGEKHQGEEGRTIGKALEKCLKDWGIAKICTVTVDNASANNVALSYLTRRLSDWNCITILNGQYMHLRCCAHILNLIVNDGLKEVDISIARIRAACKFVKSSPSRLANFKRCVCECNIESKLMVTLDVPTRWNSTYTMLDTAEKFEKAFDRLEFDDLNYLSVLNNEGGCPTSDDWKRACVFVKFLKVFYDATLVFSGSLHVTSNAFLMKLCDITKMLNFWIESNDVMLRNMAKNMKVKLDKYWDGGDNMNYMLFVVVVLDPRHKMAYIEFCFSKMYGLDKCRHMLVKLKELLVNLFEYYQVLYPLPPDSTDSSCLISDTSSFGGGGNDRDDESWSSQFYSQIRRKQSSEKKNELDKYLEDEVEFNYDGFDILKWWKSKAMPSYFPHC
ncbi:zinc finger BED domain-containing protein RICESLEEPER 2-like [Senna tora]|uniref:Zinc finger BED domain-containing protein RICESLEEPER 2-like n=1 Tax=Senna tora TaxID=362788 RepID=A0A834WT99_9FABA|nr:zinc finger BED domain-containing protein RICESLEEPER 2-like [Senna tora]